MNSTAEFNVIAALDLVPIKVKLMHKESGEGWSLEQANQVEIEYRRFLFLMKRFPEEQVVPQFDVDIFWHYHILDTMKYAIDCEQIFGYFLHHYPYSGLGGEDEQAEHQRTGARTQELYAATFGAAFLRHDGRDMATEWQPSASAGAWCNGLVAQPLSSQPAPPIAAWCNGVMSKPGEFYQSAAANTAWCNGAAGKSTLSRPARSTSAWCNGVMATLSATKSSPANTAWCNGVMGNRAWLQGATAIAGRPPAAAQNDGAFAHQALAMAA